jgi:hypothetical protein
MKKSIFGAFVVTGLLTLGAAQVQAASLEEMLGVSGAVFSQTVSESKAEDSAATPISSIRFEQIEVEGGGGGDSVDFTVAVTFRGDDTEMEAAGSCVADGDQLDCRIECDGSGFFLKRDGNKSVLLLNPEGFSVNSCGDKGGSMRMVEPGRDDSVYRLKANDAG